MNNETKLQVENECLIENFRKIREILSEKITDPFFTIGRIEAITESALGIPHRPAFPKIHQPAAIGYLVSPLEMSII